MEQSRQERKMVDSIVAAIGDGAPITFIDNKLAGSMGDRRTEATTSGALDRPTRLAAGRRPAHAPPQAGTCTKNLRQCRAFCPFRPGRHDYVVLWSSFTLHQSVCCCLLIFFFDFCFICIERLSANSNRYDEIGYLALSKNVFLFALSVNAIYFSSHNSASINKVARIN